MKYKVGQILFMINVKSQKIIPVQIIEEVSRTTLGGTMKTFIVQLPDNKKTTIDINKLKNKLYTDIQEVRETLLLNASGAIDKMIESVLTITKEKFKSKESKEPLKNEESVQVKNNNDIITVDLGDGVKAKMKTKELEKVANQ